MVAYSRGRMLPPNERVAVVTGVMNKCKSAETLDSLQGKSESYSTQADWRERRVKCGSWTVVMRHLRMRIALRRGRVAIFGAMEVM
jgi:hypothetical protein